MALVEPYRYKSRTSSRSLRSVLATTFISGMFECVIHGHSRPSAPAALLGPEAGHLPLGAEHHRPPEELRQHPGLCVHARFRLSRQPVGGIIPPQGRWSGGATCATHQKLQRACFVLLGFEPGRLLGGDDTRAGTCTVERHDRRGLIASGRHELEREGYIDGAAIGECERHEEPQAVA